MNVLTAARSVAAKEYAWLRAPIDLVHSTLIVPRLDESSRVRTRVERALATVDLTVGRLLVDDGLTRRGRAARDRIALLATAEALEAKAAQRREAAEQLETKAARDAERDRTQIVEHTSQRLADATTNELAAKQQARAQAASRAKATRDEAAERARKAKATERAALRKREQRIDKRLEVRTAGAKAELADAQTHQRRAKAQRADARRLAELAEQPSRRDA